MKEKKSKIKNKDASDTKLLYFHVGAEGGGSEIYKVMDENSEITYRSAHRTYDIDTDDVSMYEKSYNDFDEYLKYFLKYEEWYMLHPLFIHDEIKPLFRNLIDNLALDPVFHEMWFRIKKDSWEWALA